jgi:tRNA-dihydrouridine synthase
MVRETGVDGVVVGRGCQGRPWLFGDLQAAFEGSDTRHKPNLQQVAEGVYRHAELMVETFGDEGKALREIRKHMAWYFKGYVVGGELRTRLALVTSLRSCVRHWRSWTRTRPTPAWTLKAPAAGPVRPRNRRCPRTGWNPAP